MPSGPGGDTTMHLAPRLLQLALSMLWLQLLIAQQLSWSTALGVALCLLLSQRPSLLAPRGRLTALTLGSLLLWGATTPIADRSGWVESLANLLWLMAGLKLLEAQKNRESRIPVLVLLIGVGLAGLMSQSLAASLLHGLCALCCLGALLAAESGPQPIAQLLQRTARLVALLIPLVLAAFLLMPRLPAFWRLPGSQSATGGLSSALKPGEIAALVQTGGLAARITFQSNTPPPPEQRYWRVMVHRQFDGSGWSLGPTPVLRSPEIHQAAPLDQQWIVEPSALAWRPWGGDGLPMTAQLQVSTTGTLWSGKPQQERSLYTIGREQTESPWRKIPPDTIDLSLPVGSNPGLEELGATWKRNSANPAQRVQLAEHWFRSQPFSYSLTPDMLPERASLDTFLFERRVGFCEHYAASFSALMRAAGVPARVVVGYQGGEWHEPLASQPYLLLDNSDAHAWSEVWLPRQGWVEIDPTSWVASAQHRRSLATHRLGWLHHLAGQWQGLDLRWQLWVMQFDNTQQQKLLPSWLRGQWQALYGVGAISFVLAAALAIVISSEQPKQTVDPVRRALNLCLAPLTRLNLQPHAGETLSQFCSRASRTEPELEQLLDKIVREYTDSRFNPVEGSSKTGIQTLASIRRRLWDYVRKQRA